MRIGLATAGAFLVLLSYAKQHSSLELMEETATRFLRSLPPQAEKQALFPFDAEERFNWHYVPRPRRGISYLELSADQAHLANALLAAGLSPKGLQKALSIMSLETILRELENASPDYRNPQKYYFTIFGTPPEKPWGYRVEGHHLSLNYTITDKGISASPSFFGANPARVPSGPQAGWRILGAEEDLAYRLLEKLDASQRAKAIVSKTAYPDILTWAQRIAVLNGQPSGLSAAEMSASQRALLFELIEEYASNFPSPIYEHRMELARRAGKRLYFAWAGGTDRGQKHYYRVLGPEFVIEYDNTQNNGNHIHTVWREFKADFGRDLLAEHYARFRHDLPQSRFHGSR